MSQLGRVHFGHGRTPHTNNILSHCLINWLYAHEMIIRHTDPDAGCMLKSRSRPLEFT
ncbi:hypothetical protein RSAG8_01003, partial [Rhizoctonia solani AG-8 WAC10335]